MEYLIFICFSIALLIIIGITVLVFRVFEKSEPNVEYLVLIALLVAISVMGTLPTAAIPGVQAASFIIIMTGIVFGKKIGYITGTLTAIVTGLFIGLGYWTLFQMLGWGLMGLSSGIFSCKLEKNRYLRAGFGFSWGFFYGWITNIAMLTFINNINLTAVLSIYFISFPFDLVHGITNAILLTLFYGLFLRIFMRIKKKHII
ncbi:MAG: ECF transporter S component [Methanobacterium sp.]|nr:ECF transporter S component [Methanobacterium sp.]